ncbi:MAG: hypothetical protein Q9162_000738 [Coniocarpon cinnabarinum]
MALVLDFLAAPDLIRVAQTSKRMQEMVYDDSRWVSKLHAMGAWNEAEARQRAESVFHRKVEGRLSKHAAGLKNGAGHAGVNGVEGQTARRRTAESGNLIDPGFEEQVTSKPVSSHLPSTLPGVPGTPGLSGIAVETPTQNLLPPALAAKLHVLNSVRSIRGQARQEYGKVYAALSPYYFDLAQTSSSFSDSLIFKDFTDPRDQATMAQQLINYSQTYSPVFSRTDDRTTRLVALYDTLRSQATEGIKEAYHSKDVRIDMLVRIQTLICLNDEAAAMDAFVNNNTLIKGIYNLGQPLDCLDHAFEGQVNLNPSRDYFERLAVALREQYRIMDGVFPPTVEVVSKFLPKLGQDLVSNYTYTLFTEATQHISTDVWRKLVSGVFRHCRDALVAAGKPVCISVDGHLDLVTYVLDLIFGPHMEKYLDEEFDSFNNAIKEESSKWNTQIAAREASAETFFMSNISRREVKRDFMTSFKKMLTAPVHAFPTTRAGGSGTSSANPVSDGRLGPTTEVEAKAALANSRLAGINALFSVEVALTMIHHARASIERLRPFAHGLLADNSENARQLAERIFVNLIATLGDHHIIPGFNKANRQLQSYSARQATQHNMHEGVKPLVSFIELVNVGDLILQMVDVFYQTELVRNKLTLADDFQNPVTRTKKNFESMVDNCVAGGLEEAIKVLIDEIEYTLGHMQAATDYNPAGTVSLPKHGNAATTQRNNAANGEIGPTDAAIRVKDLLESYTSMIVGTTERGTVEAFHREVGQRFFNAVCSHIKTLRISPEGAVRLISDTALYYSSIAGLKDRQLEPLFRALREVSQVYLVDGRDAKAIAAIILDSQRFEGVFSVQDLSMFAERRTDWFAVRPSVEKQLYGKGCCVM